MLYKRIMNGVTKGYENLDIISELSEEFYGKFQHPKSNTILVVRSLPLRDKVLLYKAFSNNYKGKISTNEKSFLAETIMPKIARNLDKLGVSREVIFLKDIINADLCSIIQVSKKHGFYGYLAERFGKDLTEPMLVSSKYKDHVILKSYKDILIKEVIRLRKVKIIKPFFERFIKYKRENETYLDFINRITDIVYSSLNDILLEEVVRTFNTDLLNVLDYGQYNKDKEHYDNLLKACNVIKYHLRKSESKKSLRPYSSIDSILDKCLTLEILIRELSILNERYIILLKRKYGENYDSPSISGSLTTEENKFLCRGVSYVRKKIRNNG